MNKRTNYSLGMVGMLSASALVFGLANNANAALVQLASSIGHGISSYTSTDGGAGVFAPGSAINITNSRHNLSTTNTLNTNHVIGSKGTGPNGTSVLDSGGNVVGTNQICVFCHTPHGFNAVQSGPLWNKAVNSNATYAVYNTGSNVSSTFDADKPSIGSVSLACLSCHDGTQAMDNMINGPGSALMAGGYDGSLSSVNASKFFIGDSDNASRYQLYTWNNNGSSGSGGGGGFAQMGQGGAVYTTDPNGSSDSPALEGILIGTDLSNDHPISMQYCGGGISTTQSSAVGATIIANGTCRDRLFNLPTAQVGTTFGNNTIDARFWVDTNVILDSDAVAAGSASIGGSGAYPITRDPKTYELYVTDGVAQANSALGTAALLAAGGQIISSASVTLCGNGNNGDACGRGFVSSLTPNSFTPVAGAGIRTKQDIMLFTNNTGVINSPSVECASCHDPHTPNNGVFLRVSNQGSGLCLSCHVK